MGIKVKICGLTTAGDAQVAAYYGAAYLGFVFYEKSPRNLTIEAAIALESDLPVGPERVGVFVDATDEVIAAAMEALKLDWVQLHGHETAVRAHHIRTELGVKVMKAIPVSNDGDFLSLPLYAQSCDMFLFDAKPVEGAKLPGGMGQKFKWDILKNHHIRRPWLLAGGLNIHNLQKAIEDSNARAVDISSGVEKYFGVKDPNKIKAFLEKAAEIECPPEYIENLDRA
jgi:phosphoribosylanthranilate isomerase